MRRKKFFAAQLGLLAILSLALAGCRQEVRFTKVPPAAQKDKVAKPTTTNIYVGIPVRLDRLAAEADRAIPQKLRKFVDWLDDAACTKRRGYPYCVGARADLILSRDGSIKIHAKGERLHIEVPLRYALKARGLRGARNIRESKTGKLKVVAELGVKLARNMRPVVTVSDHLNWSDSSIAVLNGRFEVARLASGRIKRLLSGAVAAFEEDMSNAPIAQSAARVWKILHKPVKLQSEPAVWFSAKPMQIADGGFVSHDGKLLYRLALRSRLAIKRGLSPDLEFLKPMPRRIASGWRESGSTLRIPVEIDYSSAIEALKRAWAQPINVKAARKENNMTISVIDSEVYPSGKLVTLGLNLDVETPGRAFDLTGKAYMTAVPVIDAKTKMLEMRQIKMAEAIQIPGVGAATGRRFRLPAAPFTEEFSNSLRIDAAEQLDKLRKNASKWFDQLIGDGMRMSGRFDGMSIGQVVPLRNQFRADVDLTGEILITMPERQARNLADPVSTKTE